MPPEAMREIEILATCTALTVREDMFDELSRGGFRARIELSVQLQLDLLYEKVHLENVSWMK